MPLSTSEHQYVQSLIDAASPEERGELMRESEATLAQLNVLMGQNLISGEERKAGEIAIEIIMRLEATAKGKGWWFRAKRRVQLTQMYLGS